MSEISKTLWAGVGVALGASMVFAGGVLRDRADLSDGATLSGRVPVKETWLASTRNDVPVSVGDFYYEMTKLLKQSYVEPITDDMKLASGAVRGMVVSLGDSKSIFMDKDEFRVFLNARKGRYEGVGADFALEYDAKAPKQSEPTDETKPPAEAQDPEEVVATANTVPHLVATLVVPGGPADKAGLKPGDVVSSVDDRWVLESGLLDQFRKAQKDFTAKRITYAQISALQKILKKKTQRLLMPLKAKSRLMVGTSGSIKVEFKRGEKTLTAVIGKGTSNISGFGWKQNALVVPFTTGVADSLKTAIGQRDHVTLDLRNNVNGDIQSMRSCLAVLAPAGSYGSIVNFRSEGPAALSVAKGNPHPPKITLITDRSTQGAAAILALALSAHRNAKLTGAEVGPDRSLREIVQLPDGTGYTLVTGFYKPNIVATTKKNTRGGAR